MSGYEYGSQVGRAVTKQLGGRITPEKMRFWDAWARAEGTEARFNPFATTKKGYTGETRFNTVGVKNYPDLETGIRATVDTLKLGYYTELVDLIRRDNVTAEQLAKAVAASPWGTGTGVLRVLGVTESDGYEKAKSTAQYGFNKVQLEKQYHTETLKGFNPSPGYLSLLQQMNSPALRLAQQFEAPTRTTIEMVPVAPNAESRANQYGGTTDPGGPVPQGNSKTINRILAIAHAQIGKPYVFGTAGPKTFDCSGLIEYAYEQAGVKTPGRLWTGSMVNLGREVNKKDIQPGDWLVRHDSESEHVVMYVGNGRVIAAPHTGEVVQYQDADRFLTEGWHVRRFGTFGRGPRKKGKKGGKGPK